MDGTAIFAIKALGAILVLGIGLVVGSFISAIWLRVAAACLRVGEIPYLRAFSRDMRSKPHDCPR